MYQYLAAPITTWFLAQIIKFCAAAFKGDVNLRWLWRSGGMPSAHSATTSSLVVVIGVIEGIQSPLFAIVAVFAAIVIYDSAGVRQAVGNHSQLLKQLCAERGIDTPVKQTLGHTFTEVVGGIVLGSTIGLAYTASFWSDASSGLLEPLVGAELRVAAAVVSLSFLVSAVFNMRKTRQSPSRKKLKKTINRSLTLPSVFALLFVLAAQQEITTFSWRLWVWFTLLTIVVLQIVLAFRFYRFVPQNIKQEMLEKSKRKNKKKRRKRK